MVNSFVDKNLTVISTWKTRVSLTCTVLQIYKNSTEAWQWLSLLKRLDEVEYFQITF